MERDFLRIVLLGKTGTGKSSLANTILGEEGTFKESAAARDRGLGLVRLIDTPGLFDTDPSDTGASRDVLRCIEDCAPGPHAFLLVLKVERFTAREKAAADAMLGHFSAGALSYTTVVFTHGDQLDPGQRIEQWVGENPALRTLVQKCGGRCHVFDNRYWKNSQDSYRNNQHQVRQLLTTIERTLREKDWKYYSNVYLEYVINNIKIINFAIKFAARVLWGALLGVDSCAEALSGEKLRRHHQEMDTLRIVILGKTGSGKSSLANTIFGENIFKVNSFASSSNMSQSLTRSVHGRNVQLYDSPSFFESRPEVLKCMSECAPGPHAFLLVLRVERFTQLEQAEVDVILKHLSVRALKYTTVVFTHGENLPHTRIEEWASESEGLRSLVRRCGGRCLVFDSKHWNSSQDSYRNNQHQVSELLRTVEETVRQNGGGYYRREMLQSVQPEPQSFLKWIFGL